MDETNETIVFQTKLLVSIAVSYGVLYYALAPLLNLDLESFLSIGSLIWLVTLFIIGSIAIAVLYPSISTIKEGVAYALSPTAYEETEESINEMGDNQE